MGAKDLGEEKETGASEKEKETEEDVEQVGKGQHKRVKRTKAREEKFLVSPQTLICLDALITYSLRYLLFCRYSCRYWAVFLCRSCLPEKQPRHYNE